LEVKYDYDAAGAGLFVRPAQDIWHYRQLLPVLDEKNMVTLGEGNTPLIDGGRLAGHGRDGGSFGGGLFLKLEQLNPTGSFKDRPIAVAVSKAKEFGADTIILASSGNASASAAAYAARAGMRCIVCIPQNTDIGKVRQAIAHGAMVIYVEGSYSNSYEVVKEASRYFNWPNLSTTFINPYSVEGNKAAAYEIYRQLGGSAPDTVIVPIGAGPLLVGMAKGFRELQEFGLIKAVPRFSGVQAAQCAPVVEAYDAGRREVAAWNKPIRTAATGIADPLVGYAADGTLTLATILDSGGAAVALDEEEIRAAGEWLARDAGIYAEPSAAAALGALEKLAAARKIKASERVVCVITGHGLKYTGKLDYTPAVIRGLEELKALIK
jgi:threonine synthase